MYFILVLYLSVANVCLHHKGFVHGQYPGINLTNNGSITNPLASNIVDTVTGQIEIPSRRYDTTRQKVFPEVNASSTDVSL